MFLLQKPPIVMIFLSYQINSVDLLFSGYRDLLTCRNIYGLTSRWHSEQYYSSITNLCFQTGTQEFYVADRKDSSTHSYRLTICLTNHQGTNYLYLSLIFSKPRRVVNLLSLVAWPSSKLSRNNFEYRFERYDKY